MGAKANSCYNSRNYSWNDYCSYHEKCLEKLRDHKNISGIKEIETFETWFNKNCGYIITNTNESYGNSWYAWIVVYEPACRSRSEKMTAIKYDGFLDNSHAKEKALAIKNKLQNNGFHDTPMLEVHPWTEYSLKRFDDIIDTPYVRDYAVGNSCSRSNDYSYFDNYIRPLDIIKVKKKHDLTSVEFDHVGVYLGNDKVCHFYDYRAPDKYMKARVDDIGTFLGHTENTSRCGRIWVHHPMIPFKNYSKIARQIASVEKDEFWKGRYDLANRNCEHLAKNVY